MVAGFWFQYAVIIPYVGSIPTSGAPTIDWKSMFRKIISVLVVLMMVWTLVIVALFGEIPRADAVTGCRSKVVTKVDAWVNDMEYDPNADMGGMHTYQTMRLIGNTFYWYCPNGHHHPAKIKPKWVEWCYVATSGLPRRVTGIKFNGFWSDWDGTTVNEAQVTVETNGKRQKCYEQDIDPEQWFYLVNNPGWTVSSWIALSRAPDQHYDFVNYSTGNHIEYFFPRGDTNVSDWHW